MMLWTTLLAVATAIASVQGSRLTPPVLPLIVRNPYLSTWLANARDVPWEHWPIFWTGQPVGLSVIASVPHSGNVYPLLGRPQDSMGGAGGNFNISYPIYQGATYDASITNLSYYIPGSTPQQSPAEITISFLSPITPTSTLRQSLPASYITIYVNGGFKINIYIDINGEWVSGDDNEITWELANTHSPNDPNLRPLKSWRIRRSQEQLFTEIRDRGEWGIIHFTGPSDVKHEAGPASSLRQRFSRTAQPDSFTDSVMFTIAHIQDPIVQFASARSTTGCG